ncbi:MAG TPA: HEPN domain-containing protein [Solirubrobacterales bacterium]|nr:HEPN domain-containing protein [Solirubrobacterales bacterium]
MAAEPRSGDDLAELLMEKAAGDEKILFRLIDEEDIPDDGLGFHAQQAVEKMIKAVLAHNEVSYERTHNIAYLLTLLDGASIPKPDNAVDLPNLSPWAAELRYARQPEAVPDRVAMRSSVEQTKAWRKLSWLAFTMNHPAPIAQLDRATPS